MGVDFLGAKCAQDLDAYIHEISDFSKEINLVQERENVVNLFNARIQNLASPVTVSRIKDDIQHIKETQPQLLNKINLGKVDTFFNGLYQSALKDHYVRAESSYDGKGGSDFAACQRLHVPQLTADGTEVFSTLFKFKVSAIQLLALKKILEQQQGLYEMFKANPMPFINFMAIEAGAHKQIDEVFTSWVRKTSPNPEPELATPRLGAASCSNPSQFLFLQNHPQRDVLLEGLKALEVVERFISMTEISKSNPEVHEDLLKEHGFNGYFNEMRQAKLDVIDTKEFYKFLISHDANQAANQEA